MDLKHELIYINMVWKKNIELWATHNQQRCLIECHKKLLSKYFLLLVTVCLHAATLVLQANCLSCSCYISSDAFHIIYYHFKVSLETQAIFEQTWSMSLSTKLYCYNDRHLWHVDVPYIASPIMKM